MSSKLFTLQDDNIKQLFEKYLDQADIAKSKQALKIAKKQIKTDINLTDRKNFKGHFTASIFLLCKKTKRVLLLEHKALQTMLQPGGHIEPNETPLQAALRELAE
ncbi:MAG: NUDIX domain-containing protein, partial [Candidatus Nomurabacteria bacterium]|nr:NUDIX domain-containing protein [Candidatus Nomurabacteria bacterium]